MWVDEGVVKTDSQSPRVVDGKIIKFVGYLVSLSLFNVLLFEGGRERPTLTLVSLSSPLRVSVSFLEDRSFPASATAFPGFKMKFPDGEWI